MFLVYTVPIYQYSQFSLFLDIYVPYIPSSRFWVWIFMHLLLQIWFIFYSGDVFLFLSTWLASFTSALKAPPVEYSDTRRSFRIASKQQMSKCKCQVGFSRHKHLYIYAFIYLYIFGLRHFFFVCMFRRQRAFRHWSFTRERLQTPPFQPRPSGVWRAAWVM